MREQRLLQRHRPAGRRRRPGFFRVERPDHLWHLDMSSVWVAEHGWCYLQAAIDCCTREIAGWSLELRCRAEEAIEQLSIDQHLTESCGSFRKGSNTGHGAPETCALLA